MAVPSLPEQSPEQKVLLRAKAMEDRRAYARSLPAELRNDLEGKLARVILPHLIGARIVAAYHPMRDEISPLGLFEALGGNQIPALPWFADRDARMLFRRGPATEVGPWGVLQPGADAELVSPDIILVPLVLVDRSGTRIGQGKGHYDRALAHLRLGGEVFTIGVAWEGQIADDPLPADPWDIPLDAVATPAEWIESRRVRAGANPPVSP